MPLWQYAQALENTQDPKTRSLIRQSRVCQTLAESIENFARPQSSRIGSLKPYRSVETAFFQYALDQFET